MCLRPKLKFYLFPLTRPTLKKGPYSKNFISIFSQEFFFKISLQTKRIVQCNQCYLSKLFVYSIILPIVGLYIQLNLPKMATQKYTQQRSLRQMGDKCRAFCNTFDLPYAIICLEKTNNFLYFF